MSVQPLQFARVGMLFQSGLAQSQINDTEKQLTSIEQEISTGKRLTNPSDSPGDAAVAIQLQNTLDQRQTYLGNLTQAQGQLGQVDTSLGDLTDILQQAQTIASANVGSDVSPQQRQGAAAVVNTLYNQALSIANKQFGGAYIFAGDKSTDPPFITSNGGVQFVGSTNVLQNTVEQNTNLPFMVNGADVFGALSSKVQSAADLTPNLSAQTRLSDVGGAQGNGVHPGSILLSDGTTSQLVDLSTANSVQDVINSINAVGVGGITAAVGGQGITLSGSGTDDITVSDVGGGKTAADLGILQTISAGTGSPLIGASLQPRLTAITPIADIKGGSPVDLTSGLTITSGQKTATVTFSGAGNVQDMLNAINGAGLPVKAQINADGTGIEILNPTQGAPMTISENGGTTAADLGVRSYSPSTPLGDLNDGKGVGHATSGPDFQVTRSDGTTFTVSLAAAQTVNDVIGAINAADGGTGVTASFATTGNGIALTDTSGGSGTLSVTALNASTAVADLGLNVAASGTVITGKDVNAVTADGIFTHLAALRDALNGDDQTGITDAGIGIKADQDNAVLVRGQVGAQVKELDSRQGQIQDENVATQSLLSNLTDTDFTSAITRFQSLQQSLQASLETAAKVLHQSLMDFLS